MKRCLFRPAAFFQIDLIGTAFLDELRQLRSVDGNFGPHIHAPQRITSAGKYEDIVGSCLKGD